MRKVLGFLLRLALLIALGFALTVLLLQHTWMGDAEAMLWGFGSPLALFLLTAPLRRRRRKKAEAAAVNRPRRRLSRGFKRVSLGSLAALFVLLLAVFAWQKTHFIPESLREFGRRYPEAAGFVAAYPREHGRAHRIDLSGELRQGQIPLFLQWDTRWGYETYGSDLLAITGCGPTSLSMVSSGLTGRTDLDPLSLAHFAEEQGYYVPGQGSSWALMQQGAEALGLHVEGGTVSEDYLRQNLSEQTPMICSVWPGDFTDSGHFIVLRGFDENGRVRLNDPNSRRNSERAWDLDTLLPQLRAVWRYWV